MPRGAVLALPLKASDPGAHLRKPEAHAHPGLSEQGAVAGGGLCRASGARKAPIPQPATPGWLPWLCDHHKAKRRPSGKAGHSRPFASVLRLGRLTGQRGAQVLLLAGWRQCLVSGAGSGSLRYSLLGKESTQRPSKPTMAELASSGSPGSPTVI